MHFVYKAILWKENYFQFFQIQHKQLKGKFMTGIAAARFHSAIYTRHELFTFGLNAGQLGMFIDAFVNRDG